MKVIVKYFGMISEITKMDLELIEIAENLLVSQLRSDLGKKYNRLLGTNFTVSVNHSIVDEAFRLNDHDEIALLPPFAGG